MDFLGRNDTAGGQSFLMHRPDSCNLFRIARIYPEALPKSSTAWKPVDIRHPVPEPGSDVRHHAFNPNPDIPAEHADYGHGWPRSDDC